MLTTGTKEDGEAINFSSTSAIGTMELSGVGPAGSDAEHPLVNEMARKVSVTEASDGL
jgi:hypothetical protein